MKVLLIDNKSAHLVRLKELIEEKVGKTEFALCDPREMLEADVLWADLIVFSGGVGRSIAKNPRTFRRMVQFAEQYHKPTIGICLGAEAIAVYYGGELHEMPVRRVGNIRIHYQKNIQDMPRADAGGFMAYEFHKWMIDSVGPYLRTIATSKDGIEIFRHKTLPIWGLQFHPEVRHLGNPGHLLFEHILVSEGLLSAQTAL